MRLHSEQLARKVAKVLLDCYEFDEDSTELLDFACGTGATSQSLASECKSILGIDIKAQAVDAYNERVLNQGISSEEMRAICLDLVEHPEGVTQRFDAIVCAQAYHHIPNIVKVTTILASLLKQDGKLMVVDLLKSEDSLLLKDAEEGPVPHKGGFTEIEIKEAFETAGLGQVVFSPVLNIAGANRTVTLFIASGVRS